MSRAKVRRQPTIPSLPECLLWDAPKIVEPSYSIEVMRDWQAGRCAACGITGAQLLRDHDHLTGLVRGLICRPCNTSEANGRTLFWWWWRAGANPARILDVRVEYLDSKGRKPGRHHPAPWLAYGPFD